MTKREIDTIIDALDHSLITMAEEFYDRLYFVSAAPERVEQLRDMLTLAEYRERLAGIHADDGPAHDLLALMMSEVAPPELAALVSEVAG